jgi:hypothetical protein
MANPNGAKGKKFELDVFRYLALVFGRLVRRPHPEGFKDVGDIHLSPFVLQAKNWANTTAALNEGLAGAELQKKHADERWAVVVIKKRNANISQARVAMSLETFREVVQELRYLREAAGYDND